MRLIFLSLMLAFDAALVGGRFLGWRSFSLHRYPDAVFWVLVIALGALALIALGGEGVHEHNKAVMRGKK